MKPNETAPLLITLAPALAVAPPLLIGGAIVLGLILLLSDTDEAATPQPEKPTPSGTEAGTPSRQLKSASKRIAREDLAEALAYGAKRFTRKEAVAALENLGFRKSSAYKALAKEGKFTSLIEFTPDGLIEWKG